MVSLLAFMVLSFSMIPCADGAMFAFNENGYEQSEAMAEENEGDHTDSCSPFCICSCCAGFSAVIKIFASPAIIASYQIIDSSFVSGSPYSIALPIWQPPQLV